MENEINLITERLGQITRTSQLRYVKDNNIYTKSISVFSVEEQNQMISLLVPRLKAITDAKSSILIEMLSITYEKEVELTDSRSEIVTLPLLNEANREEVRLLAIQELSK